jgi:menaquinone-dependent protoporphyrinogen oxidase
MMRVLIVYGSRSGRTLAVAETIAVALSDRGIIADVRAAETCPDPMGYDAVIVGSGAHGGRWLSAPTWFVRSNAERLRGLPVWFFTCVAPPEEARPEPAGLAPANDADQLARLVRVVYHATFGSDAIRPSGGLFARVMRGPGRRRDRGAVGAWADRVADLLLSRAAHPSLARRDAPNMGP